MPAARRRRGARRTARARASSALALRPPRSSTTTAGRRPVQENICAARQPYNAMVAAREKNVVEGRARSQVVQLQPLHQWKTTFHLKVYHKRLVHGLHGLTLPAQQSPGPSLTEPNSKSCMREVRFDFEFVRFKLRRKDACRGSVAIWGSPPFRMFCGSLLRAQKWRMPEAVRVVRASAACCSRD